MGGSGMTVDPSLRSTFGHAVADEGRFPPLTSQAFEVHPECPSSVFLAVAARCALRNAIAGAAAPCFHLCLVGLRLSKWAVRRRPHVDDVRK